MTPVSSQLLHDLRSPLNQIIGFSEMLAEDEGGPRPEGFVADLGKIHEAGQRMLALIEENFTAGGKSSALRAVDDDEDCSPQPAILRTALTPGFLLVVDDDASNRSVLSRRLGRQGHSVETAASGREALRLMHETPFDLVLLDIMMPEMDGYQGLGHMKADEALNHIPVIMVSALSEVQSVVRCIEAGAEDYLTKPFNPILLKARVGACLEKKRARDRETLLFDQLQTNYQKLQELEKLRDDMRNMIVHDLRTPLTSVIIGVEMLETSGTLNDAQRELMAIAVGGGRILLGMINDLLDVEKMESGTNELRYEELSPGSLVDGAVQQVASLAAEGHTVLITDLAPALVPFQGDGNILSRTLVNLIANAIKFAGAGTVTIHASQDAETIRFAIRDTGPGIPEEAFGRIFEKFGQLDSSSRVGTGLGLAFCKLAVEAHGGVIGVDSTMGAGSTFSFSVPMNGEVKARITA